MFLLYLIIAIVLLIITFTIIIKIKFKFWSIQPVFHIYNIWYWMYPPGIINNEEPVPNKYTNLEDIIFVEYNSLSNNDKNKFIKFIQQYFLNSTEVKYKPTRENIIPYFDNTKKSFFSMFYEKDYEIDSNNVVETKQKLIAVMTSRLLNVCIRNNDFTTYYVDYLCVHKDKRNKGIAQQIIQTHDYYQRTKTNIPTSLFKKEGKLHAIVPLVIYRTYGFNIEYWHNKVILHSNIQIITFNKKNINLLTNFIKSIKNIFDLYISPDINILIDLIDSKNIIIYGLIQNQQILSVYFMRDSSTFYHQRKAIDCFASINNTNNNLFVNGLSLILKKLKNMYSYLLIENISHNYTIIEHIIKKHTPYLVSPTAYYFYNFAITPIAEKKALIIF